MSNLNHALHYASLGFGVIPLHVPDGAVCSCRNPQCKSIGKHPRTMNGLKAATTDHTQIRNWFGSYFADANIGIVTGAASNLVVLDVDIQHGGIDSLQRLEQQYGQLPETVKAKTGGGGFHLLFQHPGFQIKNSAGRLGAGLDIRGDGGYIVAPPSLHVSGQRYEWVTVEMELAELPGWLINLLEPPRQQQTSTSNQQHPPMVASNQQRPPMVATSAQGKIPEGKRNRTLYEWACAYRGKYGFSFEAIVAQLRVENAERCEPPLDDEELIQIARSADRQPKGIAPPVGSIYHSGQEEPRLAPTPAFLWKDMKSMVFPPSIPVLHGINKGECAMLNAYPNAGKTTLMLNISLKMAIGEDFPPLLSRAAPQRTLYLIAESTPDLWQKDVNRMLRSIPEDRHHLVDQNFACMVAPQYDDEQIILNVGDHMKWVQEQIRLIAPDLVVIDTMSQFFIVKDENSNAEMSSKVWRPLQKMARKNNCAIIVVHHYGKGSGNSDMPDLYAGRGASASGGAARSAISMKQDRVQPEIVTIHCSKTKGEAFPDTVLKLDKESRWFGLAAIVLPRIKTNHEIVVEWVIEQGYEVKASEILSFFLRQLSERRIKGILADAIACNDLRSPKRGLYCAPLPLLEGIEGVR